MGHLFSCVAFLVQVVENLAKLLAKVMLKFLSCYMLNTLIYFFFFFAEKKM